MKNLHIIATDKPSRLQLNVNTKKLILFDNIQSNNESVHLTTQHIYITNDEEIKEGDKWIYNIGWNEPQKIGEDWVLKILNESSNTFKIILTTDKDLIEDGVQAIDDEFLNWFVNNPSCEEVEVESNKCLVKRGQCSCSYQDIDCQCLGYKIIIPKEVPKQEARKVCKCKKAYENPLSEICSLCWNKLYPNEKDEIKDEDLLEPIQETLEEAAEFWDAKQTILEFGKPYVSTNRPYAKAFIEGAKWQQERMYSEDEVNEIIAEAWNSYEDNEGETFTEARKRIIEQFKKK